MVIGEVTPVVHGRGEPPKKRPPARGDCAECGKPFADREHRGVQTHVYRPMLFPEPQRPSVDEMARQMLTNQSMNPGLSEEIAATVSNQLRVPMEELAVALGQAIGVNRLSPDMRVDKLAKLQQKRRAAQRGGSDCGGSGGMGRACGCNRCMEPERRGIRQLPVIEEQWDGPVTGGKRQRQPPVVETRCCPSRPRRHRRRLPSNWWKRRCRCHECHRKPNYALIEAMERECHIRNEEGELVWSPPEVGSHDKHGRTVVAVIEDEGETIVVWDRPAPPAPPQRDPGASMRV